MGNPWMSILKIYYENDKLLRFREAGNHFEKNHMNPHAKNANCFYFIIDIKFRISI